VAGSVLGAVLLLLTPDKAFTTLVPVLIGIATILFAASGRIRHSASSMPMPNASASSEDPP